MTKWIELREKIRKIYGKHNRLILAVVKFILALFLFLLINHYVGYMEKTASCLYCSGTGTDLCNASGQYDRVACSGVYGCASLCTFDGSCSDSTFDIPVDVFSVFSVFTEKRI